MKLIFTILKSKYSNRDSDHLIETIPGGVVFQDDEDCGLGWLAYKALLMAVERKPDWIGVLPEGFYYIKDFVPTIWNLCEKTRQDALILHSRNTMSGKLIERHGNYMLYRRLKTQPCAVAIYHKNTIESILFSLKIRGSQTQNSKCKTLSGNYLQARLDANEYEILVGRVLQENGYNSAVVMPELCSQRKEQ